MNEQELEKKIRQSGVEDRESVEYFIDLARAYADAQVDAAVSRAMNEVGRISVEYNTQIAAKDAEIKRLREGIEVQLKDIDRMQRGGMKTSFLVFGGRLKRLLSPAPVTEGDHDNGLPTDDEIHFVAMDESNADRHGWISLNQKPAYVDGFEDGAKWMRNKKTT